MPQSLRLTLTTADLNLSIVPFSSDFHLSLSCIFQFSAEILVTQFPECVSPSYWSCTLSLEVYQDTTTMMQEWGVGVRFDFCGLRPHDTRAPPAFQPLTYCSQHTP